MSDSFESVAMTELRAKGRGREKGVILHGIVWAAMSAFLALVWLLTGASFPWFVFPVAATAIPLVIHAAAVQLSGPTPEELAARRAMRQLGPGDDDW